MWYFRRRLLYKWESVCWVRWGWGNSNHHCYLRQNGNREMCQRKYGWVKARYSTKTVWNDRYSNWLYALWIFGRLLCNFCDYLYDWLLPGYVGCSVDVLDYLHAKCSGKSSCVFPVIDLYSEVSPCRELPAYLQVNYKCVKGKETNM